MINERVALGSSRSLCLLHFELNELVIYNVKLLSYSCGTERKRYFRCEPLEVNLWNSG